MEDWKTHHIEEKRTNDVSECAGNANDPQQAQDKASRHTVVRLSKIQKQDIVLFMITLWRRLGITPAGSVAIFTTWCRVAGRVLRRERSIKVLVEEMDIRENRSPFQERMLIFVDEFADSRSDGKSDHVFNNSIVCVARTLWPSSISSE